MSDSELCEKREGIRDLTAHEIDAVSGGNPFLVALTIYSVADIAYDACKGFKDGFAGRAIGDTVGGWYNSAREAIYNDPFRRQYRPV